MWSKQYVLLLKRLQSGLTPLVLDLFCGGGGVSEGARRCGASTLGVDNRPQPCYVARFGEETFVLDDALDVSRLRDLVRRHDPLLVWASPPCQPYSTAPCVGKPSSAVKLIELARDVLTTLGVPFVIENVIGARAHMRSPVAVFGQLFGLRTDRRRLLEAGGGLVLQREEGLFSAGALLRAHTCLGRRRRFPRSDFFGRPISPRGPRVCCEGNIWATQGNAAHVGSLGDHAASMASDVGTRPYAKLAQ